MTTTEETIADEVLRFRSTHWMTQRELGRLLGVGASTIARVERGLRTAPPGFMVRFEKLKKDFLTKAA